MRRWNPLYSPPPIPETHADVYFRTFLNPLFRRLVDNIEAQQPPLFRPTDVLDQIMQPRLFTRRRSHFQPRASVQANLLANITNNQRRMSFVRNDALRYVESMHIYELANMMSNFVESEVLGELQYMMEDGYLDAVLQNSLENPTESTAPKLTKEQMGALYPAARVKDGGKCTVCHDDIDDDADSRVLACKHRYHAECIDEWCQWNASCPVCRAKVTPLKEEKS